MLWIIWFRSRADTQYDGSRFHLKSKHHFSSAACHTGVNVSPIPVAAKKRIRKENHIKVKSLFSDKRLLLDFILLFSFAGSHSPIVCISFKKIHSKSKIILLSQSLRGHLVSFTLICRLNRIISVSEPFWNLYMLWVSKPIFSKGFVNIMAAFWCPHPNPIFLKPETICSKTLPFFC